MKNEDAHLVNQFLTGNEGAFTTLVKKYQKSVHALTWRKVGDFHIAEEITQDTFLKAYQKLGTLKNPKQFAGWLYVIADRLCIAWHRKQKPPTESLETTSGDEVEASSYRHYEDEQREEASIEHRQGYIRSLLEKLPESERTVVTLHYLGEMTVKEISKFLGVSANTIKSRLQRARNRLKEQETMIQETLGSVHLPTTFTENIMKQVADIKPVSPTNSKPLIPWAISAATAIFIFLMIGVGSQYLSRFQKPYNLNAQSEITVEIIDAPIVLDTQAKPDLRNQSGRFDTIGKSSGAGPQVSEPVLLAAAQVEKQTRSSTKQQWIQASGPEEGSSVSGLLASSSGDVYAASRIGIYRLAPDAPAWTLVSPLPPEASVDHHGIQMAERDDTLYLVFPNGVFASKDRGETWTKLGGRPEGRALGLVITDGALYLALRDDEGIFQSTDGGKQWTALDNEIADSGINAIVAVENIVFVGTNKGLYRLHSETWEKLPLDTTKAIRSLAVSGNNLYVGTGSTLSQMKSLLENSIEDLMKEFTNNTGPRWEVFHSTDGDESWTDITPASKSHMMRVSSGAKVLAAGNAVLILDMLSFRSTDAGKTWTEFGFNSDIVVPTISPSVAVDENTIFRDGTSGLLRSTDGGESWHSFINGIVGTRIFNLVGFKNELYTSPSTGVSKSSDGGESWKKLTFGSDELTLKPSENTHSLISPKLAIADGVLYGAASTFVPNHELRIFRLSANRNVLVPIQGIPALEEAPSTTDIKDMIDKMFQVDRFLGFGAFSVSSDTFYVEHMQQLLRWKRGEQGWFNTGLTDTSKRSDFSDDSIKGFKLAVSEETVYVGKRDGSLFQSFDSGVTWKDLTANLPLRFERFNEIIFAGSTIYVATDAGVLTSEDGEHWRALTDTAGKHTLIDRMAVDTTTVYGVGDAGVYRLNNRDAWEKISPEVPDSVKAFVINNDRLYIVTEHRGMFHVSLEKE
ncbi:sigma-70 family RNA polymerase sigma factor [Candidatus Poribacteria bacterium]|nr:sigma-70 family RNA polymerase sigma factor [Candidatus Poribacteria bacterium]